MIRVIVDVDVKLLVLGAQNILEFSAARLPQGDLIT